MDTTTTSELLTTDELAAYLKVPVPTVRMWRYNGTGPKGVRLGRHVRYRRSDVDRWIENNERAQRPRAGGPATRPAGARPSTGSRPPSPAPAWCSPSPT